MDKTAAQRMRRYRARKAIRRAIETARHYGCTPDEIIATVKDTGVTFDLVPRNADPRYAQDLHIAHRLGLPLDYLRHQRQLAESNP